MKKQKQMNKKGGETHQPGWTRNHLEMNYKVRAKRRPFCCGDEREEKQKMEQIKELDNFN